MIRISRKYTRILIQIQNIDKFPKFLIFTFKKKLGGNLSNLDTINFPIQVFLIKKIKQYFMYIAFIEFLYVLTANKHLFGKSNFETQINNLITITFYQVLLIF